MNVDHLPDRPSWGCRGCDNPWPCVPAKLRLLDEYGRSSPALMIYLTSQHALAVEDIGETRTALDLYRRFVGWVGVAVL